MEPRGRSLRWCCTATVARIILPSWRRKCSLLIPFLSADPPTRSGDRWRQISCWKKKSYYVSVKLMKMSHLPAGPVSFKISWPLTKSAGPYCFYNRQNLWKKSTGQQGHLLWESTGPDWNLLAQGQRTSGNFTHCYVKFFQLHWKASTCTSSVSIFLT